jgi:hypothetical protein
MFSRRLVVNKRPSRPSKTQCKTAGEFKTLSSFRSDDILARHTNGEVASREKGKNIWSGDEFNNLRIYPGDTIMVPEKKFKPSALSGVLGWSQMFSQFAVGAAALNVIQ